MNVEFESAIKTTEDNMFKVRTYTTLNGSFKIIRIGDIRIIPNTNGQYGTPLNVFADCYLDDEDAVLNAAGIGFSTLTDIPTIICSSTGAYFRGGSITLTHNGRSLKNTFDSYQYYKKYNTYSQDEIGLISADTTLHFVGMLIYNVHKI